MSEVEGGVDVVIKRHHKETVLHLGSSEGHVNYTCDQTAVNSIHTHTHTHTHTQIPVHAKLVKF